MIKNSDIQISVYKDDKNPDKPDTIIEAKILMTETCTISRYCVNEVLVDHIKAKLRHALFMSIYGELIDNIEEMYGLALFKKQPNYSIDTKIQEIKRKIDKIMRGETLEESHDMIVAAKQGDSLAPSDSSTYRDIARANSFDSISTRWENIL